MKKRSSLILINTIFGILYEAVLAISGVLIPHFILLSFGSSVNGLVGSITQFLSIIALLKGGVGGVTRAALYKPLSENDTDAVNRILSATQKFMKKISIIFIIGVLVLASVYYFFIINEGFSWLYCFLLVLILALGTFSQYFFGMTAQLLLMADQKSYVWHIFQTIATAINIGVCILLIYANQSIHIVKIGTAAIYAVCPILLFIYTKKKYQINYKAKPDNDAIKQRWDAFGYQIATYIHENTDVLLLTFFCPLVEVSVYNIHSLVINSCIRKVLETTFGTFDAAIGDINARNEQENLKKAMDIYELLVVFSSSVLFACTLFLMPSFLSIYVHGVVDVSYDRPVFLVLLVIAELIFCFRMPYYTIITSLGLYKETKIGAYIEAAINVAISLTLVWFLGIVGVAIGTLCAMVFRCVYMFIYTDKKIIKRSKVNTLKYLLISAFTFGVAFLFTFFIHPWANGNLFLWFTYALVVLLIVTVISFVACFCLFRHSTIDIIKRFFNIFKRGQR